MSRLCPGGLMSDSDLPGPRGRGSAINPPNRFGGPHYELDPDQLEADPEGPAGPPRPPTRYFPDRSRSIVTENSSPDVGFRWSINPYRGCQHGCSYCMS